VNHPERHARGDAGVDGIAARGKDAGAGLGGQRVTGRDRPAGTDRLHRCGGAVPGRSLL